MEKDKIMVGKDQFFAKKSGSYTTDISSDKDVWCEHLAVVEMVVPGNAGAKNKETYELHIKSFFESALTGKRSWDEPPSGATTISYASDEDHKKAEEERATLQMTTRSYGSNDVQKEPSRNFSRLNVFRRWRRRKNKGSGNSDGGITPTANSDRRVTNALTNASESNTNNLNLDEQNAIAMAQALSLSEREIENDKERETMIQNVIHDSKTGAYSGGMGLAYGNKPLESLEEEDEQGHNHFKEEVDESNVLNEISKNDGDLKMPATLNI